MLIVILAVSATTAIYITATSLSGTSVGLYNILSHESSYYKPTPLFRADGGSPIGLYYVLYVKCTYCFLHFLSTFQDEGVKIFILLFQGEVETGLKKGKELVEIVPVVADLVAVGKDIVEKVPVVGDLVPVAEEVAGKELVRIVPDVVSDLVAEQLKHDNVVVCCYYWLSHISYCMLAIS